MCKLGSHIHVLAISGQHSGCLRTLLKVTWKRNEHSDSIAPHNPELVLGAVDHTHQRPRFGDGTPACT